MQLDEDSKSAIAEIGNICIAGGSNKISAFSDELVDISVVASEIRSTDELIMEVNPFDDCKLLVGLDIDSELGGKFLVQVSHDVLDETLSKFTKLQATRNHASTEDSVKELVENFFSGFSSGLESMTGLHLEASGKANVCHDLDTTQFPEKVLCYNSVISVGDNRIDFNVYFFSDAEVLIPKVLQSLGMV